MELTQEYFDHVIKGLATKQDLEALATKEEVKGLATKDEILQLEGRLNERIIALDERIDELPTRQEFRTLQAQLTEVQGTVDRINERDLNDSDAFASTFVKHDQRITKIEKQLKLKAAT